MLKKMKNVLSCQQKVVHLQADYYRGGAMRAPFNV